MKLNYRFCICILSPPLIMLHREQSLIMAENSDNKWSHQRKALGLFPNTNAITFFGTSFRGVHDWFQRELPRLAKNIVSGIKDDVFGSFRIESPMLNELRRDFVNKCEAYKKPNVGFIFEMQDSKVGKIIGDDRIPMVSMKSGWIVEIRST